MIHNELISTISVYEYVTLLYFIYVKILKKHLEFSKKFLNILVGKILSILPSFPFNNTIKLFKVAQCVL